MDNLAPRAVVLFDHLGNKLLVQDGVAIPASTPRIIIAGSDYAGTPLARSIKVNSSGEISVATTSLPLPSGAATETTLAAIKAKTDNLDVALSTRAVTGLTDTQLRASAVPVSAASLPLPSGASTEATLAGIKTGTDKIPASPATDRTTAGAPSSTRLSDGTSFYKATTPSDTQPISASALPLPTGAATAVKQPALGTAGTASADVLTVQGIASMTALKTDGSATTQPVSGTVTANIGTSGSLALDATLTGGTQRTKVTDGTNNAAVKAASTAAVATDPALVVAISPNNNIPVTDAGGSLTIDSAQLPSALIGGRLDENVGAWLGSTAPTIGQKAMANSLPVAIASDQGAIPISAASLPLPSGAATEASLAAQSLVDNAIFTDGTSRVVPSGHIFDETAGTALTENDVAASRVDSKRAQIIALEDATTRGQRLAVSATGAAKVDGSAVTQPISATSLPLPTGAAADATLTGGSAKTIVRSGTKGASTPADLTSTAEGTDHQALDVQIMHGGTATDPTQIRALTATDIVTIVQGTPAINSTPWPVSIIGEENNTRLRIIPGTSDIASSERVSSFEYIFSDGSTVDTVQVWTSSVTGSGTNTQGSGQGVVATGATANSTASLQSNAVSRYIPGSVNEFTSGVQIPDAGVANNIRRWGVFDVNNGYFYELNGTTLNIVSRKAGVDTAVASGSWNGTAFTLDTNFHRWQILYFSNSAYFHIDGALVHSLTGQVATSRTAALNLPSRYETVNSSGLASNRPINIRNSSNSRLGASLLTPRSAYIAAAGTTVLKRSAGELRRVIVGTIGGGLGGTMTFYDNTAGSGTILATVVPTVVGGLEFGISYSIGLTVVLSGVSVGTWTVVYE